MSIFINSLVRRKKRFPNFFLILCAVLFASSVRQPLMSQVKLQTGAAEINIPLYEFADGASGLKTGINLTYIAGNGLKVNDIASNVGTGWDLQVGGVITRIQNGEPDDQKFDQPSWMPGSPSEYTVSDLAIDNYYPDGYLYTTISPSLAVPGNAAFYPMFSSSVASKYKPNFVDREQDVFLFQFNGRAGRFVIGKDLSVLHIEDSKLKVEFSQADMSAQNIRTRITEFRITDENGMQYVFAEKELSENIVYGLSTGLGSGADYRGYDLSTTLPVKLVSKWFLTEIVNPATNKKIIFSYDSYPMDFQAAKNASVQTSNQPNSSTSISNNVQRIKVTAKRLNNITLPDGQRADFVYSSANRADLDGDKSLDKINFSYNNVYKYGYQFSYGYFLKKEIKAFNYSFSSQEQRYARLCLLSFAKRISDNIIDVPYSFEYYLTDEFWSATEPYQGVPARFTNCSDWWGYYNGNLDMEDADGNITVQGSNYIWTRKAPRQDVAKTGIIKKVTYPQGGYLQYSYENNRAVGSGFMATSAGGLTGGVHVSKTTIYDGVDHERDIVKEYNYTNEDGTSSYWGYELPVNEQQKNIRLFKSNTQLFGVSFAKEGSSQFVSNYVYPVVGVILFLYNMYTNPQAAILGIVATIIYEIFTPDYKDYTTETIFTENFLNKNPLPSLFRRVEIIEKFNSTNNGKTVYNFTDDVYYPITGTYGFPYSAKSRFPAWVYGLPKTIEWFNTAGDRLRKVENIYTPVVRSVIDANHVSNKWESNTTLMAKYDRQLEFVNSTSFITSDIYYPQTGRMELNETKETVYNANGSPVVTTTKYTYTEDYQARTVEKYNSSNGSEGVTYYYPQDYPSTNVYPFVVTMKDQNIFSIPIVSVSWVKNNASTGPKKTSKATVTMYDNAPNGDIKPSWIYMTEFELLQDELYTVTPPTLNPNVMDAFRSWRIPIYYSYDANGNLDQLMAEGKYKSTIYDYNGTSVIAEAYNAASDQIAYTSFEADGKGNWNNYTGIITALASGSSLPTGNKYYNLTATAPLSKAVINGQVYIISYWRNSTSPFTITGGTDVHTIGKSIGDWTYHEHKVTATSSTLTVTGSGGIDELRLYPANAQMTTYTYNPLIGMTSQCDVNNRIIYYEYDILGRLHLVRDQYKNILKKICYNYAGQPENCQTYYYNDAKSSTFTRDNCGAGYSGSSVTYSVTANSYSSTVSKAAADQLAQNDIDANGQAYANTNGTCQRIPVAVTLKNSGEQGQQTFYVKFTANGSSSHFGFINKTLASGASFTNDVYWGTYDVEIEVKYGDVLKFSLNGQVKTGSLVTYTNVSITDAMTIYAGAYQNTTQNVNYTRNNCPPNNTPSTVVYVVAPNIYTSFISQADANTHAISQTASAGQAYANANGTCLPPVPPTTDIVYTNQMPKTITLKLTNTLTGILYTFSLPKKTTPTTAGTIPTGVYNVTMKVNGESEYYSINNYVQAIPDTDFSATNVELNTAITTVTAY
jgi:hypothetical protein